MELLTLVCVCNIFTSTADLVLPTVDAVRWLMERVFAQMWQRRTNTCDCCDDLILFWDIPALFHSHLHIIFEGQSALCSIASFYDIVYGLHCCNSAKSFVKSSLI